MLVQVVVLYWPQATTGGGLPYLDKVVHLGVFAAVGVTAVRAGARPGLVLALLAAHAGLSEAVQATLLAGRSGDGWDVVADLVGAGCGVALGIALGSRPGSRSGSGSGSGSGSRGTGGPVDDGPVHRGRTP